MIEEYNAGSRNIEEFFDDLVKFAQRQRLSKEEQRHIALGLSEEELALFVILTCPGPALSAREERKVKRIARELLTTVLKEELVLDWRKRQQSRAGRYRRHDLAAPRVLYSRGVPAEKHAGLPARLRWLLGSWEECVYCVCDVG